eukprot:12900755-Prorocentrum_lima.AAC.1
MNNIHTQDTSTHIKITTCWNSATSTPGILTQRTRMRIAMRRSTNAIGAFFGRSGLAADEPREYCTSRGVHASTSA